jgi:hypothetical protein
VTKPKEKKKPRERKDEVRKIRHTNGCIYDIDLPFLIKKHKKQIVTKTIESDILGTMERKFVPFEAEVTDKDTKRTRTKRFLVDTITGSMYDVFTGDCYSSTLLRITGDGHVA